MWNPLFALLLSVAPAKAEAPEFLLGTLGVRLDLDKSRWHMTKWSDWDFSAKVQTDPIILMAWATPVRAPVDPPDPWGPVFTAKAEEQQGTDPKVKSSSVEQVNGHSYAYVDVSFDLKGAGTVVLKGAVTEIDGKDFLIGVLAPARLSSVAAKDRAEVVRRLEFTTPVPPVEYGGTVKTGRVTTKLPAGWRALSPYEVDSVSQKLLDLGIDDLTNCWTAVRPRVGDAPDVMATCSKPVHFGVVDEFSLAAADEVAHAKLFGKKAPPGSLVAMPDRSGLLYAPKDGLAFGVAPDGDQAAVTWALGQGPLGDVVSAAMTGSSFTAPHAVTPQDQIDYWLYSRTFSPMVLCPTGCLCAGAAFVVALVGGTVMLMSRRRRTGDEDDE
jgi:hypothetical protein